MSFNAPGYDKQFNAPGDVMGEYNGLYAAVTENQTVDLSDPSSGVDLAALLKAGVASVPDAIQGIRDARTAVAAATTPTLTEQWLKASLMEKATLGIVGFIALRWVLHDFA